MQVILAPAANEVDGHVKLDALLSVAEMPLTVTVDVFVITTETPIVVSVLHAGATEQLLTTVSEPHGVTVHTLLVSCEPAPIAADRLLVAPFALTVIVSVFEPDLPVYEPVHVIVELPLGIPVLRAGVHEKVTAGLSVSEIFVSASAVLPVEQFDNTT